MPLYKVVSNARPDKLISACISGQFECSYSTESWTVAPIGGLLCFDNLDSAKMFLYAEMREDLELWECMGEDPVTLGLWNITNPELGWNYNPIYLEHGRDVWWPCDTVAYKRVRLLKRIPFTLPEC